MIKLVKNPDASCKLSMKCLIVFLSSLLFRQDTISKSREFYYKTKNVDWMIRLSREASYMWSCFHVTPDKYPKTRKEFNRLSTVLLYTSMTSTS